MSTMNEFAPYRKKSTFFIVKNITTGRGRRTLRIFDWPIPPDEQRDLLDIPCVAESDIRASLLKGELLVKLDYNEIEIIDSNIDLLQFDNVQKQWLISHGLNYGYEITIDQTDGSIGGATNYLLKTNMILIGSINGSNRVFNTYHKFIEGLYFNNEFHIEIYHNGRKLILGMDYILSESGGSGTGYDTIIFIAFSPSPGSKLLCNYVTKI